MTDNTDVIVIDRKHEYRSLCEAIGGQFLRVAPSSPHRINPFDLPPADPTGEGSALLDHIQQVLGLLDVFLAEPGQRLSLTERADRKSTRLNSSHRCISYAVFCLKKKSLVRLCI